jgi:hypothetical protein
MSEDGADALFGLGEEDERDQPPSGPKGSFTMEGVVFHWEFEGWERRSTLLGTAEAVPEPLLHRAAAHTRRLLDAGPFEYEQLHRQDQSLMKGCWSFTAMVT